MASSQSRSRHRAFERKLPEKAQSPGLDAILEQLRTRYRFPLPRGVAGKKGSRGAYIPKLESLLQLDPGRINNVIASLELAAQQLETRQHSSRSVLKLVAKFDELLENELLQVEDDRDRSILELIGLTSVEEGDVELRVGMAGEKRQIGCDGRFDDPVTEHPSPAAPVSQISTHLGLKSTNTLLDSNENIRTQRGVNPEVSIPSLVVGKRLEQHNPCYLDRVRISMEIPADVGDSDESFYSCPGTPEGIKAGNAHLRSNSADSGDDIPVLHRIVYSTPKPKSVQQTSYMRISHKGKEPSISAFPLDLLRKPNLSQFPQPKQRRDFEQQMQSALGTNTTCSAESSFNAASSSPNRLRTDWSPPTSLETSFSENTGTITGPTRQKGPRLAIVAERLDETNSGDVEAPYNGDCDGETTDIDDSDASYEHMQSCILARRPKMASLATRPPKKRPLSRSQQKNSPSTPKLNDRKVRQPNRQTKEGNEKEREDEDAAFQKLAKDFFGDEYGLDPGTLPFVSISGVRPVNGHTAYIREGGAKEGEDPLLGEIEGGLAGEWDNINNALELAEEVRDMEEARDVEETQDVEEPQEQLDDEDEFGAIDPSFERAFSDITALGSTSHPLPTLHFAIQHEATRVALNEGPCSNDVVCDHLRGYCDDLYEAKEYCDVWKTLTQFSKAARHLEQTTGSLWRGFREGRGWPDNVYLTGTIHYRETQRVRGAPIKGRQLPLQGQYTITLNPLSRTGGDRFFGRFGSDRFLHLGLPSLSRQSGLPDAVLQQRVARVTDWLADEEIVLINRTWRFFYIREKTSKKKSDLGKTMQAVFFATKGVGIGDSLSDQEMNALGFKRSDKKIRREMSTKELLEWHIPLDKNLGMSVPKFWSRISLGFSTSTPTVTFKFAQIEYVDDIKSNSGEIMNDGCSVVSPAVMQIVRQKLGLEETPTAVQARLGGAKGVWMVDPSVDFDSEEVYIKVTKSQLKYKGHDGDDDWARLTLDVLTTSHDPTPATINTQLIPILEDRGVPFETLRELLEEHLERDLEELFRIIDKPSELRGWMHNRVWKDRVTAKTVVTWGGVPAARQEIAIMLLEGGFLVRECNFLTLQVRKIIDQYCEDLKTKLRIKIPNSTTLLCVADPTGTLKEGEVSLRFSNGILDPKTMRRSSVIIGDILVARNPAHLPSDIQKVKAVDIQHYHSPGLRELKDVIVFSIQGNRSLASLLSGGDYDGDKPWICWDQRVVKPFKNSPSTFTEFEKPAQLCFKKSPTKVIDLEPHKQGFFNRLIRAGISNSLEDDFLGFCTSIWEKYCYAKNSISDPKAIELAKLCSILVDAPKQGLSILPSKREDIMKLGCRYQKPAYKEPGGQSLGIHVIDRLHYDVAGQKIMEKQVAFHNDVGDSPSYEPMITEVFRRERDRAEKEGSGGTLARALKHLVDKLESIFQVWRNQRSVDESADQFRSLVTRLHRQFRDIMPPEELSEDPIINRWISDRESHFSHWSILRASAAYYRWRGTLVWYMAGHELCYIKAQAVGLAGSDFGPRTVVEGLYISLRPSKRFGETEGATTAGGEEGEEDGEDSD